MLPILNVTLHALFEANGSWIRSTVMFLLVLLLYCSLEEMGAVCYYELCIICLVLMIIWICYMLVLYNHSIILTQTYIINNLQNPIQTCIHPSILTYIYKYLKNFIIYILYINLSILFRYPSIPSYYTPQYHIFYIQSSSISTNTWLTTLNIYFMDLYPIFILS